MPTFGAIVSAVLAGAVALLLGIEIRRWQVGRRLISRRRFIIRVIAGAVLVSLFAAIAIGIHWFDLHSSRGKPGLFVAFWFACLTAGIGLVFLAIADLKEVGSSFNQSQHEIWRDFAKLLAARLDKTPPPAEKEDGGRSS